jgi:hypothetical protein
MTLDRWASAPPRWQVVLAVLATLLILESSALSGEALLHSFRLSSYTVSDVLDLFEATILLLLIAPLSTSYLLRMVSIRFSPAYQKPRLRQYSWLILPLCLLTVSTSVAYPWPAGAAITVSKPFLERAAARVQATAVAESGWQMVGLFPFYRIAPLADRRVKFQGVADLICDKSASNPLPANYGAQVLRGWYTRSWR